MAGCSETLCVRKPYSRAYANTRLGSYNKQPHREFYDTVFLLTLLFIGASLALVAASVISLSYHG